MWVLYLLYGTGSVIKNLDNTNDVPINRELPAHFVKLEPILCEWGTNISFPLTMFEIVFQKEVWVWSAQTSFWNTIAFRNASNELYMFTDFPFLRQEREVWGPLLELLLSRSNPRIGGLKIRLRSQRILLSTVWICISPNSYNGKESEENKRLQH